MRELFLKILAFLLGFKHMSYDEHEKEGRRIRLAMIDSQLKDKLDSDTIKEIYLVGAIEKSEHELNVIKSKLLNAEIPDFKFPDFNPSKDYINFYYVITYKDKYYIYALSDKKTYKDLDESMMIVEINRRLSTANLPKEARYR